MNSGVNLRELVLGVLLSVTRDGEYSHIAMKNVLDKYQYLSKQERSFIKRICEGTLEHMIWIDYVLDLFSSVKVNKMKPVIRNILRSSVYELKYMDGVPATATCNEAVKLTQKKGFQNLKGFVNGVLRNISRNIENIPLPKEDAVTNLSITYSMPKWIISQWQKTYSLTQIEDILKAFLIEAPTSIRVNLAKISREELKQQLEAEHINVTINQETDCGLFISGYDYLNSIEAFQKGWFYVQDTSSMMVAGMAGIFPGAFCIDVCAAPGGKSIHMAELLKGSGSVEARDLTPYKTGLIEENIKRAGLMNIKAVQKDARLVCPEDASLADIVIADLPCSGLGVIGKKKDIKYKMTPQKQKELVKLQREILAAVQASVKPGGTLMYSTCTINKEENEENVAWFLDTHPEFTLQIQRQLLPSSGSCDGFFVAKLVKTEEHGKDRH